MTVTGCGLLTHLGGVFSLEVAHWSPANISLSMERAEERGESVLCARDS